MAEIIAPEQDCWDERFDPISANANRAVVEGELAQSESTVSVAFVSAIVQAVSRQQKAHRPWKPQRHRSDQQQHEQQHTNDPAENPNAMRPGQHNPTPRFKFRQPDDFSDTVFRWSSVRLAAWRVTFAPASSLV